MPDRLETASTEGSPIALVSGHFYWGLHRYFEPPFLYFIVLRDPVERIGSLYDYVRSTPPHPRFEEYSKATLAEVLVSSTAEGTQIHDGQVRLLFGENGRKKPMEREHFEAAWANLCRSEVVVTFTDRINDGLQVLARRASLSIPPCNKIVNASPRSVLDDATVARIREWNRWDLLLYEKARERFAS